MKREAPRSYSAEFRYNAIRDYFASPKEQTLSGFVHEKGIPRSTFQDWLIRNKSYRPIWKKIPVPRIDDQSFRSGEDTIPRVLAEKITENLFVDYPSQTRQILLNHHYLDKPAEEFKVERLISPDIAFFTADIKLPEVGWPKILELNGTRSGLSAYPDGRIKPATTVYSVLNSLGVPVYADEPLFAVNGDEVTHYVQFMYTLRQNARHFKFVDEGISDRVSDFSHAQGIIWNTFVELSQQFDDSRFLVTNNFYIDHFVEDKYTFMILCRGLGLDHLRPQSWFYFNSRRKDKKEIVDNLAEDILCESPTVERFVIKPSTESIGRGVSFVNRDDLKDMMHRFFLESYKLRIKDGEKSGTIYNYRKPGPYIIEAYVPSKAIQSSSNGRLYDATMRIAVLTLSEGQKRTFVPVCAYWKLPLLPIDTGNSKNSLLSNIYQPHPSERVSVEDFKRAYEGLQEMLIQLCTLPVEE